MLKCRGRMPKPYYNVFYSGHPALIVSTIGQMSPMRTGLEHILTLTLRLVWLRTTHFDYQLNKGETQFYEDLSVCRNYDSCKYSYARKKEKKNKIRYRFAIYIDNLLVSFNKGVASIRENRGFLESPLPKAINA